MTITAEDRPSDSPFVEAVVRGWTENAGSTIRPAETNWHLVFSRHSGKMHTLVVGPLSSSGVVHYGAGAEILWIRFKLGAFMPHLPTKDFRNAETLLPDAARQSFWLDSTTWEVPDFDNVETFVERLARKEVLVRDPVVSAVLHDEPVDVASRTVRHRFLLATGMTQVQIRQFERAQRAEEMLRQGVPILDVVYEAGYFDQPHLTRALKHWIGHTPGDIIRQSQQNCQYVQDPASGRVYDAEAFAIAR